MISQAEPKWIPITRWAPLEGNWIVADRSQHYQGPFTQRGKDLPFDIRSYRVIFYDDSIGGKPLVERRLREHLHAILRW